MTIGCIADGHVLIFVRYIKCLEVWG